MTRSNALLLAAAWSLGSAAPHPVQAQPAETPEATRGDSPRPGPDPERTEVGILPALSFNSDLGVGVGVVAAIVKFSKDCNPYAWRLELQLFATLRDDGDGLELPFHSDYIGFDIPSLGHPRLRLTGEVAFRKFSNTGYHRFGSRSERVEGNEVPRRFHTYDRTYPSLTGNLRWQLIDRPVPVGKWRLEAFGGVRAAYNIIRIYNQSLLEQDRNRVDTDPTADVLRDLLRGTEDHWLVVIGGGLLFDTRDQEFAPTRGTFSELSLRLSPGVDDDLLFAGFTASTSWFASLYKHHLMVAVRVLADLQIGRVPIYEMTTFGTFNPQDGPGGSVGVRGVLQQRYAGKLKAIGNLELRTLFARFSGFGQGFQLGANVFTDVGRVWADFESLSLDSEPLDGPFSAFSVGLGGGLRLLWGQTFVIRADVAHAPVEGTWGQYIQVGHVF